MHISAISSYFLTNSFWQLTIEEKVIERAYKKLALDALVIQQGRLAEQKGKAILDHFAQLDNLVFYYFFLYWGGGLLHLINLYCFSC